MVDVSSAKEDPQWLSKEGVSLPEICAEETKTMYSRTPGLLRVGETCMVDRIEMEGEI